MDSLAELGKVYDIEPLVRVLVVRLAEGLDRHAAYAEPLQALLQRIPLGAATVDACVRGLLKPQTAAGADAAIVPPLSDAASAALQALQHQYAAELDNALAGLLGASAAGDDAADADDDDDDASTPGSAAPSSALFDALQGLFQVRLLHRRSGDGRGVALAVLTAWLRPTCPLMGWAAGHAP